MIGRIEGVLRERHPPRLLVDVAGVGYELEAPMTTFYSLPPVGEAVVLHTHQAIRDDAPCLYGFARRAERDTFRRLLRVSGVGGKVALALLSGLDADGLARCVQAGDAAGLARIPGIGKKTAERLLFELRDRLPGAGGGGGGGAGRAARGGGRRPLRARFLRERGAAQGVQGGCGGARQRSDRSGRPALGGVLMRASALLAPTLRQAAAGWVRGNVPAPPDGPGGRRPPGLLEGPRSLHLGQVCKAVSGTRRTRLLQIRRAATSNGDRWL